MWDADHLHVRRRQHTVCRRGLLRLHGVSQLLRRVHRLATDASTLGTAADATDTRRSATRPCDATTERRQPSHRLHFTARVQRRRLLAGLQRRRVLRDPDQLPV